MPEFLRKICNHLSENRPFNGSGVGEIFFKTKRKEQICLPTTWDELEKSSASQNMKTSTPLSIPQKDVIPDGPIRLVLRTLRV